MGDLSHVQGNSQDFTTSINREHSANLEFGPDHNAAGSDRVKVGALITFIADPGAFLENRVYIDGRPPALKA